MNIKKFILILARVPTLLWAKDTVIVVGGIQHEALVPIPTIDNGYYLSNSYLDIGMRWDHNDDNQAHFQSLEVMTRAELTQWPLLGYDADFGGYGVSHLHVGATFDWGKVTIHHVHGKHDVDASYGWRIYRRSYLCMVFQQRMRSG